MVPLLAAGVAAVAACVPALVALGMIVALGWPAGLSATAGFPQHAAMTESMAAL
jgi:hypothetical protein